MVEELLHNLVERNSWLGDRKNWKNTREKKWQAKAKHLDNCGFSCLVTSLEDSRVRLILSEPTIYATFNVLGQYSSSELKLEFIPTDKDYMACFVPGDVLTAEPFLQGAWIAMMEECRYSDKERAEILKQGVFLVARGDSYDTIYWETCNMVSLWAFKLRFDLRAFPKLCENLEKSSASLSTSKSGGSKELTEAEKVEIIVKSFLDLKKSGIQLVTNEDALKAWVNIMCPSNLCRQEVKQLPFVLREFLRRIMCIRDLHALESVTMVVYFRNGEIEGQVRVGAFRWALTYSTQENVYCKMAYDFCEDHAEVDLMLKSELHLDCADKSEKTVQDNIQRAIQHKFEFLMSKVRSLSSIADSMVSGYKELVIRNKVKFNMPADISKIALLPFYAEHKCILSLMRALFETYKPVYSVLTIKSHIVLAAVYMQGFAVTLVCDFLEYLRNKIVRNNEEVLCWLRLDAGKNNRIRATCATVVDAEAMMGMSITDTDAKATTLVKSCFDRLYKEGLRRGWYTIPVDNDASDSSTGVVSAAESFSTAGISDSKNPDTAVGTGKTHGVKGGGWNGATTGIKVRPVRKKSTK